MATGKDEKSTRSFAALSHPVRKGFLLPAWAARVGEKRVKTIEKRMSNPAGFMKALKCRECGREYPLEATHVCEFD